MIQCRLPAAGISLLFVAGVAHADCSTTAGSADFGTVDSISLYQSSQSTTASAGFSCTGSALSLITTNYIKLTLTSSANAAGTQPRLLGQGNYIPYTVYLDSSYSNSLNIGGSYTWTITSLLGLLGLFNSSSDTIPLYLSTGTGSNVPAGTYTDTLTLTWDYSICWIGVIACLSTSSGTTSNQVPVTLIVSDICVVVDAPDVDFGSAALPSSFSAVSGQLQVRCTLQSAYAVNLSSNAETSEWRVMTGSGSNNSGYTLQYQIYQADGTTWNSATDLTNTGTGLAQSIAYTANVNASQDNRPSGTYADTITVTVSY